MVIFKCMRIDQIIQGEEKREGREEKLGLKYLSIQRVNEEDIRQKWLKKEEDQERVCYFGIQEKKMIKIRRKRFVVLSVVEL